MIPICKGHELFCQGSENSQPKLVWAAVGATFMQAINRQDYLWNNKRYLWSSLPGNSDKRIKDCEEKKGGMYENLDDQFTGEQGTFPWGNQVTLWRGDELVKSRKQQFFGKV